MKKMVFAAMAAFAMVSLSSVFARNAKFYNAPDGLANDTVADTVVVEPSAEPEVNGGQHGDGMYLISNSDTTETTNSSDAPVQPAAPVQSDVPAQPAAPAHSDAPAQPDTVDAPANGSSAVVNQ